MFSTVIVCLEIDVAPCSLLPFYPDPLEVLGYAREIEARITEVAIVINSLKLDP
jgi:hypothetical protein